MPKVLVMEDAEVLLKAWVQKFESQGFEVLIAKNADSAVKTAIKNHPDLVVSDLPESQSAEAVKKMREYKWGSRVPILFLNSWQDHELFAEYSQGIDDHLAYNWSLMGVVEKAKRKLMAV